MKQADFIAAVLDPDRAPPPGLTDGAARPAGRRFGVYRNNVAVSLTEAMHQAFPVIARLLGQANMDGLAGMFLRAHPPDDPRLMHYGAAFPDYLATLPQLAHLGYLADVARLDLALRRSYHATDADPVAPETLTGLAPEALTAAYVTFAPAMQVLRSDWPVFDIWRVNTEADAPKPRAIAQDVLITRPGFDPAPQPLPTGGADWINALRAGASIGDALDAAQAGHPGFDPGATLALLIGGGAITGLNR
jgi:hypothetical protein